MYLPMLRTIKSCGASFLLLSVVMALCQFTMSQEVTATITGRVTDQSGAAIVGAAVVARDLNRGTEYRAKANELGVFNIQRLPVGTYEVKIDAQGFAPMVESPLTLDLNQVMRLNFELKAGTKTEVVDVTATAPTLQTDTATVGTIVDARTNDNLPLATRNPVQLTLLAPGAVTVDPAGFNFGSNTAEENAQGGGRPYINGNREQSDNFLLDGIDNSEASDNLVGLTPSPDAIQEFNLITQNASAEFGNFQGGIVNVSIKSGTNQFHGTLFEFLRNTDLNANKWENKFNPAALLPTPVIHWNTFGATFGGPIIKNKLFFFADYQGGRFDTGSGQTLGVLTAQQAQGNFGGITDANGQPIQLLNPCAQGTGIQGGPACQLNGTSQPFANNVIPANMLDPAFTKLVASKFYPQSIGTTANGFGVAVNSVNVQHNSNQGDLKIDYNASEKDRVYGRYSEGKQNDPSTNSQIILGSSLNTANLYNTAFGWTHTFNSSLLNDARFGTNHIIAATSNFFNNGVGQIASSTLGINNGNQGGLAGLPAFGFSGGTASNVVTGGALSNLGNSLNFQDFASTVIQFNDGLTYTHGRHITQFGFQMNRYRIDVAYSGNAGELGAFIFDGSFTSVPGADFALGLPVSVGRGAIPITWYQRNWLYAGYAQDNWRITDHLTLNLGLRYEARTPWTEINNRQVNVDTLTGALQFVGNTPVTGVGTNGFSSGLYKSEYGWPNFQPRIGFAQQIGSKSVIRGAYTISSYLEGTGTNLRLTQNPPFTPTQTSATNTTPANLATATATPFNVEGGFGAPAADPFFLSSIFSWAPKVQPAIAQQWNLTVQRELAKDLTLQAGYVGQHVTHEMVPVPVSQGQLTSTGVVFPFLGGVNPQGGFGPNHLNQVIETTSIGSSSYNALQVVLQKRLANGLEGQLAYTYSKCMTDSPGYFGTGGNTTQAGSASPFYQNIFNSRAERSQCYWDLKHVVSSYALYDLPFGKGRKYANHLPAAVNTAVGDWALSAIVSWHTGFPIALTSSDNSGTNSLGPRPNCNDSLLSYPKTTNTNGLLWFNPAFESAPAPGTFGNCPAQGPVVGPGYVDADMSLHKDFPINEARKFQFRADFLNAFNHPNFAAPSGITGLITSTQDAREIQLALKFYF